MKKDDNMKRGREEAYRGHLPPPFYSAIDELAGMQHTSEARGFSPEQKNQGAVGYDGVASRHEVYDLERNRTLYGSAQGQRDSYRHLGDRRWMNDAQGRYQHEESSRYGYRSMDERMEKPDHRGKGPRSYRRPDQSILEDVNERLSDDPWLDASDIETDIKDGEVILSGTVDDRSAKRRAEDIVANVRGVKDVENRIRISTPGES